MIPGIGNKFPQNAHVGREVLCVALVTKTYMLLTSL